VNTVNWDERYGGAAYVYGTEPNDFLAAVVDRIPMGRILSLAEGEGRNAVFLASRGYDVVAVDASATGLGKAQDLAAARGVRITTMVADLASYLIEPDVWAGIISCYCHLPPLIRVPLHRRVVAGLKPGGVLVLEAFSKEQLGYATGGPQSLEMLMSLEELTQELAGLQFSHAVRLEREVREGSGHTGLASVVQVLGVKP
jgi:SAM-dependent methyltransferase